MFFRSLIFIAALISTGLSLLAQQTDLNFTSITSKEGLSSNTVNVILKDRFGLMWFGTDDGLAKFDGTNFTIYRYRPGKTNTLLSNEILSLHQDRKGNLWIGTSGGSVSMYDRQKDAFINYPTPGTLTPISNSVVLSICSDHKGHIWVGHFSGLNVLNPSTGQVTTPKVVGSPQSLLVTSSLFEDSKRNIWIGSNNGLKKYETKTGKSQIFRTVAGLSPQNISAIIEDKNGDMWIGSSLGLFRLSNNQTNLTPLPDFANRVISALAISHDSLWVGTTDGLDIFNTSTGQLTKFKHDNRDIYSLTSNGIRSIYIDDQGTYWLGTTGGGINKYDKNLNLFSHIQSNVFDAEGLNNPIVTSFAEDADGNIIVGTQGKGLSLFNYKTRRFKQFGSSSSLTKSLSIMALEMTRQKQLLAGTYGYGLFIYDWTGENAQQLSRGINPTAINSNDVYCFKETSNGEIWVGTNGGGINVLDRNNKVIKRFTPNVSQPNDQLLPINGYIRDIEEDDDGNVWIATYGGGIAVFNQKGQSFKIFHSTNSKLPNAKVPSLLKDRRGNIWAGTFGGGVAMFDRDLQHFRVYSEKDGLANNTIYKVLEDDRGLIWVSTNRGISSIDPQSKKINNYNYHNGVQKSNFVPGAGIKLKNGELFFGGLEGFNYFNPQTFTKNLYVPPTLITELKISNQIVSPSDDGPIDVHISIAKQINLDYKQNFALSFVALNYTAPEQNQYAYKLEGFDKEWNYIGSSNTASYTNLDPGNYTFRVRASNNDGVWNNTGASIKIYVQPPFWRTIYAYIFYLLLATGLLLYSRYLGLKKLEKKFLLQNEKTKAAQEKKDLEKMHELDRLKIKFLTNLSHEFRTPISLILGPVDTLITQNQNTPFTGQLQMVKRNAKRLLNLVNQLLDFRKMEEGELQLNCSEGELIAFVKEVFDAFKDVSERKEIQFTFNNQIAELPTLFDHDKIERILFNLLSNAFKFTLKGGKISVDVTSLDKSNNETHWIGFTISDTGIGIPAAEKEKIFDRFFQHTTATSILNQGTGIGLSITKEFVKMHGGTITVDSTLGKGTTFNIQLPFTNTAHAGSSERGIALDGNEQTLMPVEELPETFRIDAPTKFGNEQLQTILLIEDNEDFRFYLKENLRLSYKIYEAADGKEGWQKALAHHPQLIVSDISMPYMDGIELCKKIKGDKRTSHIPVILLTALAAEEDQLKGLQTGANDYITKPFNFEVLNAKIRNLLVLNDQFKSTYSRQIKVVSPEVVAEDSDSKFLKAIMIYLEENLTNPQLSVEELSRHMGMSRSSLYAKLLELTGQTPVEYIRSIKLDKAAVLLEKSDMNVSQIAYSVGFSTPNYFAKSFKAKFNVLPSEYKSQLKKNK